MCGIIGYIGNKEVTPILMDGLKRLEYRGYDSAGIAIAQNGSITLRRAVGKISKLEDLVRAQPLNGNIGLGHSRWATHGRPSEENAHPHTDCSKKIVVIHNGIIENYLTLKENLLRHGHKFVSETDTEVVSHLIEEKINNLKSGRGSFAPDLREPMFFEAVRLALKDMTGAYALAILWAECPGTIVAAKTASPLVIGLGQGETFLASDVPAFLEHTRKVVFLEDGEMAVLNATGCRFFNIEGKKIEKVPTQIQWDRTMAEKSGYRHFMLKEINEQPRAVEDTLRGRLYPLKEGLLEREAGMKLDALKKIERVHFVSCGTAYYASLVGKYLIERYAGIQAYAEPASEFMYRDPILTPETLIIAVSQSGETADTLAAVKLAKQHGAKVMSVCNVLGSALTRTCDYNFYTHCGPEFGVASTKAFVGQLTALTTFTLHLALALKRIKDDEARDWVEHMLHLPSLIRTVLKLDPQVLEIAKKFHKAEHFLFIGRHLNYPIALEGALKLKEISYIHAEGYAAGEMKHGPIALIDSEMPVLTIATASKVSDKIFSNMQEAKARGASLIALYTEGDKRVQGLADYSLPIPPMAEYLSPIVNVVPLQLLAYHIADLRGCDIDQPRNLAKSVTVE